MKEILRKVWIKSDGELNNITRQVRCPRFYEWRVPPCFSGGEHSSHLVETPNSK